MNQRNAARRVSMMAALTALALALSWLERLIPMPIALPGVKLGLANLVVLVALYLLGEREALLLSVARVLIAGFLFGSFASMLYALSGALVSAVCMILAKRCRAFTAVGASILGGTAHNVAQLLVAMLALQTTGLKWYLPTLMLAGAFCGLVNGLVALRLLKALPPLREGGHTPA